MRAAFGLVGLLVTIGIIVLLMRLYLPATVEANKKARNEVSQWAGQDSEGRKAGETLKFTAMRRNDGRLSSVLVDKIASDDPMAAYWGLKTNDSIVEIEQSGLDFSDMSDDDVKNFVLQAFTRRNKLVVMRDGQKIALPQAPVKKDDRPALQRQLDNISGAGSR